MAIEDIQRGAEALAAGMESATDKNFKAQIEVFKVAAEKAKEKQSRRQFNRRNWWL